MVNPEAGVVWLALTVAALHSRMTPAMAETYWCDIVLRGLLRCRVPKSFSLLRMHALPPWVVPRFTLGADGLTHVALYDLREVLRAAGREVPTDDERHALSAWANAVYDQPNEPLGAFAEKNDHLNLLRRWYANNVARNVTGLAAVSTLGKAIWSHVMDGRLKAHKDNKACDEAKSPGDMIAERGALRLHTDLKDYGLGWTHIEEWRDHLLKDAFLTVDVTQAEVAAARKLAEELPGHANFTPCSPRRAVAGVVTATTLKRLPRRAGELSLGDCTFTTIPVKERPHFVGPPVVTSAPVTVEEAST